MNRTVVSIIKKLKLKKHREGGYFSETYRSKLTLKKSHLPKKFGGSRSHSTTIYFLLSGKSFSAFHRLKADEVWHFYSGSPLNIYVIQKSGKLKKIVLGKNHYYQTVIHAEQWFAAEVTELKSYSLVGCTVSPGFDYKDFELAEEKKLIKLYPHLEVLISRLTIK
ncbi:MAG: cupin domain-containing protein [Ignavibacteriae bacterium]|nr:cupin domain-containing protein [Ignavibacteriota bacterium]